MQLSKLNNIIVLKGMASNVVDEAIVVLKPNVKIKQSEYNVKGKCSKIDKNKKMTVMKEAENTINMYVKKLEKNSNQIEKDKLMKKYKILQVLNILLVLSIIGGVLII